MSKAMRLIFFNIFKFFVCPEATEDAPMMATKSPLHPCEGVYPVVDCLPKNHPHRYNIYDHFPDVRIMPHLHFNPLVFSSYPSISLTYSDQRVFYPNSLLSPATGDSVAYGFNSSSEANPGFSILTDAARRKISTRESAATLKAWLQDHRKNPYPTKSEKVMLSVVTKMTLTQVSTWFANARRRLKKENRGSVGGSSTTDSIKKTESSAALPTSKTSAAVDAFDQWQRDRKLTCYRTDRESILGSGGRDFGGSDEAAREGCRSCSSNGADSRFDDYHYVDGLTDEEDLKREEDISDEDVTSSGDNNRTSDNNHTSVISHRSPHCKGKKEIIKGHVESDLKMTINNIDTQANKELNSINRTPLKYFASQDITTRRVAVCCGSDIGYISSCVAGFKSGSRSDENDTAQNRFRSSPWFSSASPLMLMSPALYARPLDASVASPLQSPTSALRSHDKQSSASPPPPLSLLTTSALPLFPANSSSSPSSASPHCKQFARQFARHHSPGTACCQIDDTEKPGSQKRNKIWSIEDMISSDLPKSKSNPTIDDCTKHRLKASYNGQLQSR